MSSLWRPLLFKLNVCFRNRYHWKTSMTDKEFSISTFAQFSALQSPFAHVISTPYRLERITYLEA